MHPLLTVLLCDIDNGIEAKRRQLSLLRIYYQLHFSWRIGFVSIYCKIGNYCERKKSKCFNCDSLQSQKMLSFFILLLQYFYGNERRSILDYQWLEFAFILQCKQFTNSKLRSKSQIFLLAIIFGFTVCFKIKVASSWSWADHCGIIGSKNDQFLLV